MKPTPSYSRNNFWDIGPHEPLNIEETWDKFISISGGNRASDDIGLKPNFSNADYIFKEDNIILELKEIETEFIKSNHEKLNDIFYKLFSEKIDFNPFLDNYPEWFIAEYIRIARPAISRILKKANKQIRETKEFYGYKDSKGIIIFVNDGFTSLAHNIVIALACDLLTNSYSSIDCFLYTTINRYVEIEGSNEPKLLWVPIYSDKSPNELVSFIDNLGMLWFDFLENELGKFTSRIKTENRNILKNSKSIILPSEKR